MKTIVFDITRKIVVCKLLPDILIEFTQLIFCKLLGITPILRPFGVNVLFRYQLKLFKLEYFFLFELITYALKIPRQRLNKRFTLRVKLSDSIIFLLGLSAIVN